MANKQKSEPKKSLKNTAVLIYRLITFWMPIISGYLLFHNLRKTTFSGFHIRSSTKAKSGA